MAFHHPNGAYEGHPCAFASNWINWQKSMKMIYSKLAQELHFYFRYHQKNSSFFVIKGDEIILEEHFLCLFVELSRQVIALLHNCDIFSNL